MKLRLRNSEADKLNEQYIEFAIIHLWQIDVHNLIKVKAALAKNFHIQPSEIDNMSMWEYELFRDCINDLVKEENDKQEEDMKGYDINSIKKMSNPQNLNKMTSSMQPKMPAMPSMPKFK